LGHAGPGLIAFPSKENNVVLFGICKANPDPQNYQCEDITNVLPRYPKPFANIRVVYLGGCKTFLPPSLPEEFVKRGAWSAVGWKVEVGSLVPFGHDAPHRAFWYTLCGDREKKIVGKTVLEAAEAAGETYRGLLDLGWPLWPSWDTFVGVAGNGWVKLY